MLAKSETVGEVDLETERERGGGRGEGRVDVGEE